MVSRVFLKPRSVQEPYQGDFQYVPIVKIYEAATAAALEDMMSVNFTVESQDTTQYLVIESIQYSTVVVQTMLGGNPPILRYSALLHATQVLKI
jgi:hypothetical protein